MARMAPALSAKNDPPAVRNASRGIPQAQSVIDAIQLEHCGLALERELASNCDERIQPSHSTLRRRDWEHHDCAAIAHGWRFSVVVAAQPTRWIEQVFAVGARLPAESRHHARQSGNCASHEWMKARVDCENSKASNYPAELRPTWNRDFVQ